MTNLSLPAYDGEKLWELLNQDQGVFGSLFPLILTSLIILFASREKKDPFEYQWFERPQQNMSRSMAPPISRNISQRMSETDSTAVVFWGSQSGTAETLARRLTRELKRALQLKTCLVDLSDMDPETLSQLPPGTVAIFLLSTYGNGDPSDNAVEFMDYLATASTPIPKLRYAIFGLGNSNYQYYNKIAHLVSKRLVALGSGPAILIGKTDEVKQRTEEDFVEWKDQILQLLSRDLNIQETQYRYEPMVEVSEKNSLEQSDVHLGSPILPKSKSSSTSATPAPGITAFPVKTSYSLASDRLDGVNCLHVELDLGSNYSVKYKTGDYLEVWPCNSDYEVEKLLIQLGIEMKGDTRIEIKILEGLDATLGLPNTTTISALFKNYVQVSAPLSRETVKSLGDFAPSKEAHDWLHQLSNQEAFRTFISGKYYTLADLLEQSAGRPGAWTDLPLSFLLENLPIMKPRRYSISSSSLVAPRQLSLTVAMKAPVQRTLGGDAHMVIPGLATSYLTAPTTPVGLRKGTKSEPAVLGRLIRSKFKLPSSATTPLVLVAAGSGIAPFRAFLHERARLSSLGHAQGSVLLAFGCRNPLRDNLYNAEIQQLAEGPLAGALQVHVAFSRPESASERRYVQDVLRGNEVKQDVTNILLDSNGAIYFCGSTTMAKAAGKVVLDAVRDRSGMDEVAISSWLNERKRFNKWQEDVWG